MASSSTSVANSVALEAQAGDVVENEARSTSPGVERKKRWLALLLIAALCSSVFLAALDITIVTTALPTIAAHFDSSAGYVWVGSAFLLGATALTPNWGKFSDIWGRKAILLSAAGVFLIGSALCGASQSIEMIIAGRAVQGMGAGGLLSLTNTIIGDLYSPRERGKYYGMIGMVWAVASSLGPVVGGAFTKNASWRWCFYINLPISSFAIFIIFFTLKLQTPKTSFWDGIRAVDWFGSIAITGGTVMLLLGLQFGGVTYAWSSATVICLIIFGVVTIVIFFIVAKMRLLSQTPIIPPYLFSNLCNLSIILVDFLHGIAFTQVTYFLPLYFQSVLGEEALMSGVLLLPFALSLAFAATAVGIFLKVTGRYTGCIKLGLALSILGSGLLYDLPKSHSWAKIIIYQLILGTGLGMNFQPPLIALQSNVPAQENAAATATFSLVRNLGSAIAVVIGSAAFANEMSSQTATLSEVLGGSDEAKQFAGSHAQANVFRIGTLDETQKDFVRSAYFNAIRIVWIQTMCCTAVGFLISWLIKNKKLQSEHVEVEVGLEGELKRRNMAFAQTKE